jgi:hypothetical protein
MSIKNFSDTIGNRTRDLPACNPVPQPTAPPAACRLSVQNIQNIDIVSRLGAEIVNVKLVVCEVTSGHQRSNNPHITCKGKCRKLKRKFSGR